MADCFVACQLGTPRGISQRPQSNQEISVVPQAGTLKQTKRNKPRPKDRGAK